MVPNLATDLDLRLAQRSGRSLELALARPMVTSSVQWKDLTKVHSLESHLEQSSAKSLDRRSVRYLELR